MASATKLIIHGSSSNVLDVQLSDILRCIEGGDDYLWSLLWITAVGEKGDLSVLDFEKEVNRSAEGILYDWQSLNNLSGRFIQMIEMLVCGDKNKANLRRYAVDEHMFLTCRYVIELVDSSYWIVSTSDEIATKNIQNELKGVAILD